MYTPEECDNYKQVLRQFMNGYGREVQDAIIVALTLFDKEKGGKYRGLISGDELCPVCREDLNHPLSKNYCNCCGFRIRWS